MFALKPREKLLPRAAHPFRWMLSEEFPAIFNRLFGEWPLFEAPEWEPRWEMTIEEKEKEYLVRAELPGFEPPEVEVEVKGEELTLKAVHKEPEEGKGEKKVGRYAEVKQSLLLPPGIVPEKIEAQYRNGMLEIHLPKAPEVQPRRIEVRT